MAQALSAHLLRKYSTHKPTIKNHTAKLPQYKLKEAINYIHENLEQKLTLTEIASELHISPNYFSTQFKQSTGLTPHQYVMKSRIEKAKQLLSNPEIPIAQISQQVGFENQSHFTRIFRQQTQTTPKTYRNTIL